MRLVSKQKLGIGLIIVLLMTLTLVGYANTTVQAATPGCQDFAATGHQVCGRFLEYWQANGGLVQQGYPISDVFEEKNAPPPAGDGKVHRVQYFQRARFEEHTENQPPYDVLLGLLGSEQGTAKYNGQFPPTNIAQAQPCQHFPETNLDVCGRFLEYWKANGGLAQQGLPISAPFNEKNADPPAGDGKVHLVQYFQRARFELHSENTAPYDVLLGLLGQEQYNAKYNNPVPTPTPAPSPTPSTAPTAPPVSPGPAGSCLPTASGDGAQACVTNPNPVANVNQTVYGRLIIKGQPAAGAVMNTTWHYKSKDSVCNGTTDASGVASCTLTIGAATKGFTVKIDVVFTYNGQSYSTSTSFTPQ